MRVWSSKHPVVSVLATSVWLIALFAPVLSNGAQFSSPAIWSSIDGFDIASGDFNEDEKVDLVVGSDSAGLIAVHLGGGDGGFLSVRTYPAGPRVRSVAVGDLDEDGHQDVVTANSILFGVGDGTFGPPVLLAVSELPEFAEVGDFNADGHLDVAVATLTGMPTDEVAILLGRGDGTFAPEARYGVGSLPRTLAAADLNGDGNQDLLAANRNPRRPFRPDRKYDISILMGNGDGTFQRERVVAAENARPHGLAIGDFNQDKKVDFAVGSEGDVDISVHLGNGDGSFAPGTRIGFLACPIKLALGDFDLDGNQDLATSNWCGSGDAGVLLGDGSGLLVLDGIFPTDAGVQQEIPRGLFPVSIAAGDFDGDGRQDLATANWQSFSVSTLQNQGAFSDCLDSDGDGFGSPGNPACAGGLHPDCNDRNPDVFPGAAELCDRLDNDCDLLIDEGFDGDGDQFTSCGGDCDDGNADINPGVAEVCDNIDNNCDGAVDRIVQAACSAAPSTVNFSSRGNGFSFDVSLTNLCTGEALDPALLAPAYISGFSSASTGTIELPAPYAGPGCDDFNDDGIWEDINARKISASQAATLDFSFPADGSCATLDGSRQEIIAIMQDVAAGEDADLCFASAYADDPAVVHCCDAIRVLDAGRR